MQCSRRVIVRMDHDRLAPIFLPLLPFLMFNDCAEDLLRRHVEDDRGVDSMASGLRPSLNSRHQSTQAHALLSIGLEPALHALSHAS